jgi:chemotaxis signal transduction protein
LSTNDGPATVAVAMREAFDGAFARAPEIDERVFEDLLAIRAAAQPYALRLSALAGLYVDRRVVPLPSAMPALLGLVGLRGELVPVYDLGALLGHASRDGGRWLSLVRAEDGALGLAFDQLDGFARVPRDAVTVAGSSARGHVQNLVRLSDGIRPLVDVDSVLKAVREHARKNKES